MLAYPTENNKGKFIAIFWSIFNLGGVVGAAVSLGQNYDSSVSARDSPRLPLCGSYLVLIIIAGKLGYVPRTFLGDPRFRLIDCSRICGRPISFFDRSVTRGTYVSDPVCRRRESPGSLEAEKTLRYSSNCSLTLASFAVDHVSRADDRGGANPVIDGRPKQNDQSRRFKSHDPPTAFMEDRDHRPLGRPPNRPVHHPPLPHVLCQQLLLHLAVQRLQRRAV